MSACLQSQTQAPREIRWRKKGRKGRWRNKSHRQAHYLLLDQKDSSWPRAPTTGQALSGDPHVVYLTQPGQQRHLTVEKLRLPEVTLPEVKVSQPGQSRGSKPRACGCRAVVSVPSAALESVLWLEKAPCGLRSHRAGARGEGCQSGGRPPGAGGRCSICKAALARAPVQPGGKRKIVEP